MLKPKWRKPIDNLTKQTLHGSQLCNASASVLDWTENQAQLPVSGIVHLQDATLADSHGSLLLIETAEPETAERGIGNVNPSQKAPGTQIQFSGAH